MRGQAGAAFLLGTLAFISQQLLLRELTATVGDQSVLVGVFMGSWLACVAAGSLRSVTGSTTWAQFERRLTFIPVGLCLGILAARAWGRWGGEYPSLEGLMFRSLVVQGPAAWSVGRGFRMLVQGQTAPQAARTLALESAGSAAGLAWLVLARTWGCPALAQVGTVMFTTILCCGLLRDRPGAVLGDSVGGQGPRWALRIFIVALVVAVLPRASSLERLTCQWSWPRSLELVLVHDGPIARVCVLETQRQGRMLAANRFPMYSTTADAAHNEGLVHLPLSLHPAPKSVLLIGGGVGGNAREVLKHPVQEVVLLEIEPTVLAVARGMFAEQTGEALADPRVVALVMDGARYLHRIGGRYDVIILDLPDPYSLQLARFYSAEFLTSLKDHLRPGGFVVLQLPPMFQTPKSQGVCQVVARTFDAVFSSTVTLCARMDYLVGRVGGSFDLGSIVTNFNRRGIQTRFLDGKWLARNLDPGHRKFRLGYLEAFDASTPVTTTDRPVVLAHDMSFYGTLGQEREGFRGIVGLAAWLAALEPGMVGLAFALVVIMLVIVLRTRTGAYAAAVAAVGGLTSMSASVLTLYVVQVRVGSVAGLIPALAAAFIVGHSLGAALSLQWATRLRCGWGLVALSAIVAPVLQAVSDEAVVEAGLLISFVAGMTTGGLFVVLMGQSQTLTSEDNDGHRAGTLYGADTLGAMLGAFVGVPLALPLIGARATGWLLALLLSLVLAISWERRR